MASQQHKSWRSANKNLSQIEAQEVDGKTIELCDFSGWTEGIHRGFVSNALINKYSIIQGPKVIFVNLVMTTEDEKVLCFLIKVYRRSYM
jgi:hypothetical protein